MNTSSPTPPTATDSWTRRPLLVADSDKSRDIRNLRKPVRARRMIDDMESIDRWHASAVVELSSTTDRCIAGSSSLRISTLLRNPDYIAVAREANGTFDGQAVLFDSHPFAALTTLEFDEPQDWSDFTRISVRCFVHPTDMSSIALAMQVLCSGASAGPNDAIAIHYFGDLKAGEWNELAWEFPELQRDAVTEFSFFQPTFGVTGTEPRITLDLDQLELQSVEAEPVSGWAVADGVIAHSHLGYRQGASKVAVAAESELTTFEVLDARGEVLAQLPVQVLHNDRGAWSILDFTEVTAEGEVSLRLGDVRSEPFPISNEYWVPLAESTLNSFYGMRCGWAVEGIHGVCHTDVFTEHEGDRRTVAGGWHDAANLTQGPGRTHLSIYALAELADSLRAAGHDALADRAAEEAGWGATWSLGVRFGPGIRALHNDATYYTDGIVGTDDDMLQEGRGGAGYDEFQNILAAVAAARAARLPGIGSAEFIAALRSAAAEDFEVAIRSVTPPETPEPVGINKSAWRDRVGYLCLAAVELFSGTGDDRYRVEAVRLARQVLQTQERTFVDGIDVSGFFYEDAEHTRIMHEYHDGFEDSALLALEAMQDAFPDEADWIDWYAGLSIYAEHFAGRGSAETAPFAVLPAAVWRESDIDAPHPVDFVVTDMVFTPSPLFPTPPTPDVVRGQMLDAFSHGVDLGAGHRLMRMPLWYDHVRHGSSTIQLGKAIGLAAAASARRSAEDLALAERQLEWVLGANPFSRSIVYGVGHDWWQNFAVAMPNLVGGMSLGFNSYGDDAPAWGNNAVFPYKEQWIYASSRLAMMLARVGIPASAMGAAPETDADGDAVDLAVSHRSAGTGRVTITIEATGSGRHSVELRAFNLQLDDSTVELDLGEAGTERRDIEAAIARAESPWVVVAVPDGKLSRSVETTGVA